MYLSNVRMGNSVQRTDKEAKKKTQNHAKQNNWPSKNVA